MDTDTRRGCFLNNLVELIQRTGKSAESISLEMGRNKSYLNHILNRRRDPSFSMLLEICEYFQVSPSELFHEQPPVSADIREAAALLAQLAPEERDACLFLLRRRLGRMRAETTF